uniref:Putative nuclease HARBI1 n=1 Tax=Leptobrachium leishanense TaxID=445787 RepID=A0A8C5LP40_9ANUR
MDPLKEMTRGHNMAMDPTLQMVRLAACGVLLVRRIRRNRQRRQEEMQRVAVIPRAPRLMRTRISIDGMSDSTCRKRYRLNRDQLFSLYEILKDELEPKELMHIELPGMTKMLSCLQYLASGSFQNTAADLGGIDQSTFSNLLNCFLIVLRGKYQDYIGFPSTSKGWRDIKLGFFKLGGIPNVLGAIDCTHMEIKAPSQDAEAYLNRELFYSLNVQMVCDADMRIMNVLAGFPGSAHDSFILANSSIARDFQDGQFPDGWLLGDSGYPLRPWLMTPYRTTPGAAHESYNKAHQRARSVIDRTFSLLKMRFRCLNKSEGPLQFEPDRVVLMIKACVILHNMAVGCGQLEDDESEEEEDGHRHPEVPVIDNDKVEELGADVRERIIRQYFADVDSD